MEIYRTKSLIILLIAFAGLFAYLLYAGLLSERQGTVDRFSVDDVALIERINMVVLKKNAQKIILSRNETGTWMVNERFEADQVKVNELLYFLQHAAVNRPVSQSSAEGINHHIDEQGVKVEFFTQGNFLLIPRKKKIRSFMAGMETPEGEFIYMRLLRSDTPYEVAGPGSAQPDRLFRPDENHWRNPVLLDLRAGQIKQVDVHIPDQVNESFRLINENGEGTRICMHDGKQVPNENINKTRLLSYIGSFYSLFYEKLLDSREIEEIREVAGELPFMLIAVTDALGNELSLSFYHLDVNHATTLLPVNSPFDPNRFLLQIEENEYALTHYLVFQRIMRPLSFFLSEAGQSKNTKQSIN